MGRQVVTTVDTQGRPLEVQVGGLLPITYTYDTRGRLETANQGARSIQLTYDSAGFADSVTDPLDRTTTFAYDAVGRVVTQNLPGGRTVTLRLRRQRQPDVAHPPRPARSHLRPHARRPDLELRPAGRRRRRQPVRLRYNLDRQLTQVDRPDGESLTVDYDTAGRPEEPDHTGSHRRLRVRPVTGNLNSVTVAGGGALTYTYDGPLMKTETWSGPVAGSVSRTYDNDLNIVGQTVNGGAAVAFQYDDDDLMTQAGALDLSYHPQNGLLTDTHPRRRVQRPTATTATAS